MAGARICNGSASLCSKRLDQVVFPSPLLLINHWIPPWPPSPRLNPLIGRRSFLRRRVRRRMGARGFEGAIVAVDFYDSTAVVRVAAELNR